jgi:hypothetical protein
MFSNSICTVTDKSTTFCCGIFSFKMVSISSHLNVNLFSLCTNLATKKLDYVSARKQISFFLPFLLSKTIIVDHLNGQETQTVRLRVCVCVSVCVSVCVCECVRVCVCALMCNCQGCHFKDKQIITLCDVRERIMCFPSALVCIFLSLTHKHRHKNKQRERERKTKSLNICTQPPN